MNHHLTVSRFLVTAGVFGLGQMLGAATAPADAAADEPKAHASAQPGKSAAAENHKDDHKPADGHKSADAKAAASTQDGAKSTSYPDKETYPHSGTNASPTALIAGGNTSGGQPIAPSASVIAGRVTEWKLSGSDVQAEIDRGGAIERTKEIGADQPTGNMEDEALHTLINNRLLADSEGVRVATTQTQVKNGVVTMNCAAATPDMIGRAIAIILDTPGVTKVTAQAKIDTSMPGSPKDDAKRIPETTGAGAETK
jgi:osmotically-inducible protein OsmY